jgi:hypothetical protein
MAAKHASGKRLSGGAKTGIAWTLKSQDELDRARDHGFDGFIFDSFEAKQ